jgi:hypothetical protein
MPEVGRVLDAARRMVAVGWTGGAEDHDGALKALGEAMTALDAKLARAGHEPTWEEQERAWGEIVAGDQILSAKTNRWYEITRMVKDGKGNVKLNIKGSPKPITRPIAERTAVRRGVTGEAVDIMETIWSMQTRPDEAPRSVDVGPMLTDKVDDDE